MSIPQASPFPRLPAQEARHFFTIKNDGHQPAAFRITATDPKWYSVEPNFGRVEPRRDVIVKAMCHALREEPSPEAQCKDELWIESTTITPEKESLSLANIWNTTDGTTHLHKMEISYRRLGRMDAQRDRRVGPLLILYDAPRQRTLALSWLDRRHVPDLVRLRFLSETNDQPAGSQIYVPPRHSTPRPTPKQVLDKKLANATTEINRPRALLPATPEPEAKEEPDLGNGGASRKEVADEILDLTDQVASVALFGSIGVGKSFVAHSVLGHTRTKAKFDKNCHLMRCDDLPNSLEAFLKRLSEAIQTNVTQLQSRLQSSPPLILLMDGVDSILDPVGPEAEEILATIEEFGCYEHVCLVTTSRIYPDIHGFQRVEVPALSEDGARETFYNLCNLGRSSAVNTLLAKLDFHPLSIELLASYVRENDWDESMLLEKWGNDETGAVKMRYYRRLRDAIEPMLSSPAISKIGTTARDVLEAIATFPSGVEESELERILRETVNIGEVVDVLCKFSLIYRQDGFVRMLSPFQFYFLEFMVVPAKTEEVINVQWGPNCMPAPAVFPVYTAGPIRDLSSSTSSIATGKPAHQDTSDTNELPLLPVHTAGPPNGVPSQTATPQSNFPSRRTWIKRLPRFVKKRLLALFGRRVALPSILVDIQEDPPDTPPAKPVSEKPLPAIPIPEPQASCTPVAYDIE